MEKYDLKTAYDYINGSDLDGYDIDKLENDSSFMKIVINISKDKNMYNLCGEDLKQDIDFIEFLITKFSSDEEFVTSVVDEFLTNNKENDIERLELLVQARELVHDPDIKHKYDFILESIYLSRRVVLDSTKNEIKELEIISYVGLGFAILKDMYNGSNISLKFFAKKMVEEIFGTQTNIEKIIHNEFNSKEDIEKMGLTTFILDYIRVYDSNLADFVFANINVLDDIKIKFNKAINNFDKYNYDNENSKYELIIERVLEYSLDSDFALPYNIDLVIYYVAACLGINDTLITHDHLTSEEDYKKIMKKIQNKAIDESKMSFEELKYIKDIKNIMKEILSKKIFEEPDGYIEEEKKEKPVVLEFKKERI